MSTSGVDRDGSRSKAAATLPCLLAVCTDERRNGPGREHAPYLKGSEECQGRGVEARDELYGDEPGPPHTPAGALQPLRRRARREAARVGHGPCAAGPGCAAHWRARCRDLSLRSDSRRACAAVGRLGVGGAAEVGRPVCRTGYRSARDLFRPGPTAFYSSPSAEGRKVGGSADGAWIFTGGHCRASLGAEGSSGSGGVDR